MAILTIRLHVLVFIKAWHEFGRNNSTSMAAGIAYWTALSMFPLIVGVLSVLGYIFASPADQRTVLNGLLGVVPVSEEFLRSTISEVIRNRGALSAVAAAGSIWSGAAVFAALRRGINNTWQVEQPRSLLLRRGVDFLMFLFLAAAVLLVMTYTTLGATTVDSLPAWARGIRVISLTGRLVIELGILLLTVGIFMVIYRLVPNAPKAWSDLWFGSTVGGVLFLAIRYGFTWFAASFGNFNAVYGSLGAMAAIMIWSYLSAITVLLGSQVAATHARELGSRHRADSVSRLEADYGRLFSLGYWRRQLALRRLRIDKLLFRRRRPPG